MIVDFLRRPVRHFFGGRRTSPLRSLAGPPLAEIERQIDN
jgi:hypothetical protein